VENLGHYHTQWAFLSCGGLDPEGTTNTNQLVVESERAMIRMTERTIVLADSTKWGKRDMVRTCGWRRHLPPRERRTASSLRAGFSRGLRCWSVIHSDAMHRHLSVP